MRIMDVEPGLKRYETEQERLINKIIEKEWEMFDKVNNQGGRADCQDDDNTFYIMRFSNFIFWGMETLRSYYNDLTNAETCGRNLLTEKYAYMMEYSEPKYFAGQLKPQLPAISEEKTLLITAIAELLVFSEKKFAARYPAFSGAGRPLIDDVDRYVSFYHYLVSELKTYSLETLKLYKNDIMRLTEKDIDPSYAIHECTAGLYGYASVDDAEERLQGGF